MYQFVIITFFDCFNLNLELYLLRVVPLVNNVY